MARIVLLMALILTLTSCTSQKVFTKYKTVEVLVPVSSCAKAIYPSKPMLPIHSLNTNSSDEQVVKSYVTSIKILETHIDKLEEVLDVYK